METETKAANAKTKTRKIRQQETSFGGRKKLQPNSATWTFLLDLSSEQFDKLIKRDGLLSRYTACKNEDDLKRWLENWIQEFGGDEYVARLWRQPQHAWRKWPSTPLLALEKLGPFITIRVHQR